MKRDKHRKQNMSFGYRLAKDKDAQLRLFFDETNFSSKEKDLAEAAYDTYLEFQHWQENKGEDWMENVALSINEDDIRDYLIEKYDSSYDFDEEDLGFQIKSR